MKYFYHSSLLVLFAASATSGFVVPATTTSKHVANALSRAKFQLHASPSEDESISTAEEVSVTKPTNDDGYMTKSNNAVDNKNPIQAFADRFLAAGGGPIGERGEVYFLLQAIPILGVAVGGLPFISDALHTVLGPGLFLAGVAVMVITALDMGDALTPWPKPNGEGLVTTGLYGQVRHPMYSGLLSSLIGFSVLTGSVDRLLMVGLLWFALQVKSDYEEVELAKAYPEYPEYQEKVKTKFVPRALMDLLQKNQDGED